MGWTRPPQSLVELFEECLPRDGAVERRVMFACPVAFVRGNMFAGVFQDQIFARLPPQVRGELEAVHGTLAFEPIAGRPMKAYALVPEPVLTDEAALADFLAEGFAFTLTLPPKETRARKPRKG